MTEGAPPMPPEDLLPRLYELSDDIAEQMPSDSPDWQRLAQSATQLGELARKYAPA